MPPAFVYTFLFSRGDFFTFGATLVFICVNGATFLNLARLFLIWRDFFLFSATFFYLARLFLFGATFFNLARLF